MELNLVVDRRVRGKIYPALAQHQAEPYTQSWREFDQHWPYTIPLRLQEYCDDHGVGINIYTTDNFPNNSYYPIGLGFFDFSIDYFGLLPNKVFSAVFQGQLKILFYYHEGDNPYRIKERLDALASVYKLNSDCYVFVSGNTAARSIPGFVYFCDFELWYWSRNKNIQALPIHYNPRDYDFTALVRLHKTWRAIGMANLHQRQLLDCSQWSYCETGSIENDSPIEIDVLNLRIATKDFLSNMPRFCDSLSQSERNNHSMIYVEHFIGSYCNIVFETHFDADGCLGTFLTEKTFKPIKHGQMFFIAGPAGSLQLLRDMGYRVFDLVFDNFYDRNASSTRRWELLCNAIAEAKPQLPKLFEQAREDLEHNQQLFLANKAQRLNNLFKDIHEQR